MTYKEYQEYILNRQNIISKNRSNRLKGLASLPVPDKIESPKVRIAYSKIDHSYVGRLKDDDDIPEDCYIVFENSVY